MLKEWNALKRASKRVTRIDYGQKLNELGVAGVSALAISMPIVQTAFIA
jgi:hypothetical protein